MAIVVDKQELAKREIAKRKSKSSFAFFVHNFCMMWAKEGGDAIPFKLWDFQKDAANTFQTVQKIIVLKARQMGMSWLAMAYVVWCVLYKENFHVYITSIGLREVNEQMERIRFIWYNLPDWLRGDVVLGGKGNKDNDSLIQFSNGSAIHAIASSKSAGHGGAPGLYILDEFARKEQDVMAWRAIKPSLGKKSQVIIISTSNGFNNLFAELWFGATSKSNEFTPVFFRASSHPDYSEQYLAEQKRDFAGDLQGFLEAFPEQPEDAFMSSSKSVFPHDSIKEWKDYIRKENIVPRVGRIERDYVRVGDTNKESIVFNEDESGQTLVWEEPVPERFYTVGCDTAEGLVQGDWTVAVVLDTETLTVVALHRAKVSAEYFAYTLETMCRYYNNAWLCVEVNKNTELLMGDLKVSYPWLYCRMVREKLSDQPLPVPGFISSSTSKPRIIGQLRRHFLDTTRPLRIYSDVILDEFAGFEEDGGKLEAASGLHDDCVIAVALSIEAMTTMPRQRPSAGRGREEAFFGSKPRKSWRSL